MRTLAVNLAGISAAASLCFAGAPMHTFLEDDLDFVVSVRSVPEILEVWEDHPVKELFDNDEVQRIIDKILVDMEEEEGSFEDFLKEEFDLTMDEFTELFSGQVGIALYGIAGAALEAEEPEIVLVVDYDGEPSRLHELLDMQFKRNAKAQKEVNPKMEHRMIKERFMGETLYFDEAFDGVETYIEDGYALVDGIFVLATPEERLRTVVEGIKGEAESPLAKRANFIAMRDESGRGDFYAYVDLDNLSPPLLTAFRKYLEASGVANFGLTPDTVMNALSLDALHAAIFSCDLASDRILTFSNIGFDPDSGITGLFAYKEGPLPEPPYIPDEPLSSGVALFDISEALGALETMVNLVSPFYGSLFQMQLENAKKSSGVDLRASLIENFGKELISFSDFDPEVRGQPTIDDIGQVVAIEIRDSKTFNEALETLKGLIPGFETVMKKVTFDGHTIYHMEGQPDPLNPGVRGQDVSYTLTRTHLLFSVGRLSLLREALTRLNREDGGFWARSDIRAAFDEISRPRKVARSYTDLQPFVDSTIESIHQLADLGGGMGIDPELIPKELDVPFFIVSESNLTDDGIVSRGVLLKKDGEGER